MSRVYGLRSLVFRESAIAAKLFKRTVPLFPIEHFVPGALGTFAFLPPDLGDPPGLVTLPAEDLRFQFINQHPARPVPVHGLRTFLLAFDTQTRGPVLQQNARGDFVDVLASRPPGAHERFLKVLVADPEPFHFAPKTLLLLFRHRINSHRFFGELSDVLARQSSVEGLPRRVRDGGPPKLFDRLGIV